MTIRGSLFSSSASICLQNCTGPPHHLNGLSTEISRVRVSHVASIKAITTVVNGVVVLGNNPLVDTTGRIHDTERLYGAIGAPGVDGG